MPAAFEGLTDPPCALFLRGALPADGAASAGIVGTRDATYGRPIETQSATQ